MYLDCADLNLRDRALLTVPCVGSLTVLREEDRTSRTWPCRFAVDPDQACTWLISKSPTILEAVRRETSIQVEQRLRGWLLQFSGSGVVLDSFDAHGLDRLQERFGTIDTDLEHRMIQMPVLRVFRLNLA